jgi:hypothetical protein
VTRPVTYKGVEVPTVTDEEIERVLNEWTPKGWALDRVQFVVREASRRPAMAFVFLVRAADAGPEGAA